MNSIVLTEGDLIALNVLIEDFRHKDAVRLIQFLNMRAVRRPEGVASKASPSSTPPPDGDPSADASASNGVAH